MPDHAQELRDAAEAIDRGEAKYTDAERVRQAADRLELLERQRHPLFRLGEAIMRGQSAPVFEPDLRRFVLSWHEWDGAPPTPGSFVIVGHGAGDTRVLAPYRVHAFERLAVGGRLATLEPVEPHDVPVIAHVRELPSPVADVTDLEDDAPQLATLEGEATHVPLCSSTFEFQGDAPRDWQDADGRARAVCERFHEHDGEHLGPVQGVEPRREVVWDTGAPGESGGVEPRVVPADSEEADRARIREGVTAWTS